MEDTPLQLLLNGTWKKKFLTFLALLPADVPFLVVLWLVPLAIYLKTLPNSIYFIDAGVTLAAAYILGIPTPPGYPTTTLIGHLFTLLPLGTPLYRLQLFSILTSLTTLTLIYFFIQRLFKTDFFLFQPAQSLKGVLGKVDKLSAQSVRWVSFSGSVLLAFCYQFWSQTLNVQPYIFTDLLLLTALFVLTFIRPDNRQLIRLAIVAIVLAALASGGSTVMVFMVLPAVIIFITYIWNHLGLAKTSLITIVGLVIVVALYSYLPLRAMQHPFLNWGDPQTPELFMAHVQGMGLSFNDPTTNKVTGFTGSPSAFIRVAGRYFYLLWIQFTPLALPLLAAGIFYLWKKNRQLLLFLGSVPATNLIFGGLWLSGNQESWFLFSYIVFAIFMGIGLAVLLQLVAKYPLRFRYFGYLAALIIVLSPLFWWFNSIDRSQEYSMTDYANNLYANLPKDAVLIGIYDTFQAATLDRHEIRADRKDVFPVMTNMIYVLPWYREHLRRINPDLFPQELDKFTTFSTETEYNEMLNYYVDYLLKKGKEVYVTQPVFSRSVLVGSNNGVFSPDPKRFVSIPAGLTTKLVSTESASQKEANNEPKDSDFDFKFINPAQYDKPYYYLEQGYESSYKDLVSEYALAYITYAEKLLEAKQATGQQSSLFGAAAGGVNLSAGAAVTPENKKRAAELFERAFKIAPDSLEVLNRLAIAYANQGDFKKTTEFFQKAAALNPDNLSLQFNVAKSLLDDGKVDQSRTILKKILASTQDGQVAKQASNLLSVASASDNPPLNWQTFKNEEDNLKFFYPQDFSVSFGQNNVIKLTNNGKNLDELTYLFYGRKLKEGENIDDLGANLPFVMDGVSLGTQPVQIPGFQAKVKTYATGEKTLLLFLLRHNEWAYAVRVNPGNSNKSAEFSGILQSIRVLNP